ncbi:radical SAM protein [Opitutaceae bacterium EW11]|nr:radical SAM protein [Opitutaceae bacterium EW11]
MPAPLRGRGADFNPHNRFERLIVTADPDCPPEERPDPRTQFLTDASQSILVRNDSPDVQPYRYGLNAYRGCEHGCAYCYARPYHEYLGMGSGIDFETKIMVKVHAPDLLRKELSSPKWEPQPIGMSGVTDCYQPAERQFQLTRKCLQVLAEFRNPVGLITKNHLVTRDIDVLSELAHFNGASVFLTITTLDADLAGRLEPRASRPQYRLAAIRELAKAGVPVGVMMAPVIPGLTDHELPSILEAAAEAGATRGGYILLRLPYSVKDVFIHWLDTHEPGKKERVLSRLKDLRGGKLSSAEWYSRFKGEGIFAAQLNDLFKVTARRLRLNEDPRELSAEHFRRPGGVQLDLFG